jgi:hypothetical protein
MRRICWSFSPEPGAGLAAIAAVFALTGCGDSAAPVETRTLSLGRKCYRVPVSELVYFSPSGRSGAMHFSNERVRDAVPDYSLPPPTSAGVQDSLYVAVSSPTPEEAARDRAEELATLEDSRGLWYALGEFSHRIVEPIPATSLHRVRPLLGGPTWVIVAGAPDPQTRDSHLVPGFRVAECAEIDGGRLNRCTAYVERDGVRMTMYTTEANLALRDSLASFAIESLERWKSDCGAPPPP